MRRRKLTSMNTLRKVLGICLVVALLEATFTTSVEFAST